jgi:hypothetical protein
MWRWAVPVLLFVVGMWSLPLAVIGPDRSMVPGDLGDARFNTYILEHFHRYSSGEVDSFWDAPFMFPQRSVIAHSDNLLGTAPLYSAFRRIGANRETAYQLWMMALLALNFWCCFLALRSWSGRVVAAACGAYLFAFGIFSFGQFGMGQVYPRFMLPVVFLLLWKALHTGRMHHLAWMSLGVVYQFYCGIYLGFLTIYGLFFLFVGHSLVAQERPLLMALRRPRHLVAISAMAIMAVVLLLPLMVPYMRLAAEMGTRSFAEVAASIPRPWSYFFSHPGALSWRDLAMHGVFAHGEFWLHYLFPGGVAWLAVLTLPLVLFNRRIPVDRRRAIGAVALAFLLSMVVCMDFGGFTLYRLVHALPGFSALRSMDRIIHIQIIFFILLLVMQLALLPRRGWWQAWMLVLPVLVVLDSRMDVSQLVRFDKWHARALVREAVQHITATRDDSRPVIAYAPVVPPTDRPHDRSIEINITAMLAAQELGLPVVNAYTGSYPPRFITFFDHRDAASLQYWCERAGCDTSTIQLVDGTGLSLAGQSLVSLRAPNGYLVCANTLKEGLATPDRSVVDLWETFRMVRTSDGRLTFMAHNGAYLAAELEGDAVLTARSRFLGDFGLFMPDSLPDGSIALKAHNGRYVAVEEGGTVLRAVASMAEGNGFRLSTIGAGN